MSFELCSRCNDQPIFIKSKKLCKSCYDRTWRENNPEYNKQWQEANSERYKELLQNWRADNAGYQLDWQHTNLERYRELMANRRARVSNAEGTITKEDISSIMSFQDNKCVYCSKNLSDGLHVDHIVPLIKGGTNWPDNIQLLCPTCNLNKLSKWPWIFEASIGYSRDPEFWNNFSLYNTPACL